ncbi:hypothetical protein HAP47_0020095 [Bradyrhizobium sp. 41S5]|uniref:hypothetical protein n=1 Tax=Bradyrhizobium sp. 41S5 TaxID=1404443 RepID=UPI00156BA984|nr:hypothetical protein [Bradyrhizobium sp. 41S5]UFX48836.1 hypothetical protein HAP47_0020095 [Bradyrhizobium sp. 41S5]
MPSFSSENWSGVATASVLGILVVALAFAVVGYVEWSSDANLAQFMSRSTTAVAVASSTSILPLKGRTGCGQANKSLPSLALPLE